MVVARLNLDMDVLRTFVTGVDLGSFAKAADRLGRSPSAVSLHLRKLESQVGQPLMRKQGRGLALTEAGETLMAYARRILELNDEARLALGGLAGLDGWVRVGVPQDFAETWLPPLLARFQRAYPQVRVEARVDRGASMADAVSAGALDLALTWGTLGRPTCETVADVRLAWIAAEDYRATEGEPVALVAFDDPCAFRRRATDALEAAGLPWRHVFATSSLVGVWAAVRAGLGITARCADMIPPDLRAFGPSARHLPDLGSIELVLHRSPKITAAAGAFTELLLEAAGSRLQEQTT
ncbi:LysR substrate-binding domain-containing protein [Antarcticirhabdus aurantiaca]|uniref:LysR substrate-binding domain-containing protein n=1 Tax=Antarcticirhabdus aurantiaca TaxID=2606717 RepID=A0ACD4NNF6_9HYPH|nr:LysR substrate-binding domain-containing protein [Antarcticirhabdus aurantiaca]WAJ28288.1 LysR substrate-binding domain-containing protein [Jeongeuplla avenae]